MQASSASDRIWTGRPAIVAIAAAVGLLAMLGNLAPVEHGLRTLRDAVRHQSASGELHIVEIDARSLQVVDRWPWPRGEHAVLIDRLTAAGARSIAFDVDFSSPSTPREDDRLARALERAGGGVILPTLRQSGSTRDRNIIESLPIPAFRDHSFLGAVSILPDRDGYVRSAPLGIVTADTPRPSLSAMLSGQPGTAFVDFPIDFAIDPASIPRHSFVDVSRGSAAGALAGKDVLIGATAVEMGDRYAVPRYGVIPGVVIQALAAETLRNGVPRRIPALLLLAIGLAAAWWVAGARRKQGVGVRSAVSAGAALSMLTALEQFGAITGALVPALGAIVTAAVLRAIGIVLAERRAAARIDLDSGLPNRRAFRDIAGQGHVLAGMIDRYDEIATTLGSDRIGGFVARLAERLTIAVGAPVHRIEDRVVAWVVDARMNDDAIERLRALLLHPIEIDGRRIDARIALGIAAPRDSARATIDAATAAANKSHEQGLFLTDASDEPQDDGVDTLSLMGELDEAIDRGEIEVHYQPKLALASDRIESAEALVRWIHPERGRLGPDLFIPLAERHDRIDRLTLTVTRAALDTIAQTEGVSVAVNLSAKLLTDARFNRLLDLLIAEYPGQVGRLIFEVTESAAMADMAAAIAALEAHRARGIVISMDDYGTGQSTLSYLRQLPISELKIDRMFVQNAHINPDDAVLVRSTIELAHQLGIRVVAEGVEDRACLDFLRSVGCDYAQGWLVGKPMPRREFLAAIDPAPQIAA